MILHVNPVPGVAQWLSKMTISFPALVQFLGHLHPMFVHLPIGFLIALGILEATALVPRYQHVTAASRVLLVFTVPLTAASILCGWLLAGSDDYDAQILFWHRWLGVGIGVATLILLALHTAGWLKTYRAALAGTLGLVAVGGHYGASLTHGSGYLSLANIAATRDKPRNEAPPTLASQSFYAAAIQPLFTQYCITCHGPNKTKGKLRLDTLDYLLKGGGSGPALIAGEPSQSLLLKRLHLPPDDEDHMPPDAKPQPSADQIALLEWWIASGAATDKTIRELNPPEKVLGIIQPHPPLAP
jgi:mono/diheme cytochrome c family protein